MDAQQARLFRHQPWMIDELHIARTIHARGWALAVDPPACSFAVNDGARAVAEYPIQSVELERFFDSIAPSRIGAFELMADAPDDDGLVKLSFNWPAADPEIVENSSWYFPLRPDAVPLPSDRHLDRVILNRSETAFLLGGATLFGRCESLLRRGHSRSLRSFSRILDWGCGAGRLTRFLLSSGAMGDGCEVHGIDIDDVNVTWCRENLPGGHFAVVSPRPPTLFRNNTFDLVFGISVMTHLRERHQRQWLQELRRITEPGALVLLSVQGPTLMALNKTPSHTIRSVAEHGIAVTGANPQIEIDLDGEPYYVDVFHSREYIRDVWSEYFDILDILDAVAANQDLVVMQRRATP
jgi:SAM-dependent methyltransferase